MSAIQADKDAFISHVLAALEQHISKTHDPAQAKEALEAQKKKLLFRQTRYRQMYADGLIPLQELKTSLAAIEESLKAVEMDLEKSEEAFCAVGNIGQWSLRYTDEILRFLELDSFTNTDMRQLLDHISVNRDGNVHIKLKHLENS